LEAKTKAIEKGKEETIKLERKREKETKEGKKERKKEKMHELPSTAFLWRLKLWQ